MEITMEIAVGVIIVVAVGGLAFLTRANCNAYMVQNLGKEYMKEFGIDDGQKKYNHKEEEGEKRE